MKQFAKEFKEFVNNIELGLGWLRAVAQGYKYNYIKIKLWINFLRNLMSWGVIFGWGLDGCARCRKVTITVTIKYSWGAIFKEFKELRSKIGLRLGLLRAVAQGYN